MTRTDPSLLLLIPAYNEENRIEPTLREYAAFFRENYQGPFHLIVVLNGCRDDTLGVVNRVARDFPEVSALNFPDPIGKGGALIDGLRLAPNADLIGYVDADGATGPKAFLELARLAAQADCVIGSRWLPGSVLHQSQPWLRRFFSRVFHAIVQAFFWMNIQDTQCPAKVMRRAAIEKIHAALRIADLAFDVNLLYALKREGFRVLEVPTEWTDKIGSKVTQSLLRSSLVMFLSIVRLRLIYTPFYRWLRPLRPLETWIYQKLRAPAPRLGPEAAKPDPNNGRPASENPVRSAESHTTFFRQSGWLVVATASSGFFMMATQIAANSLMRPSEYSTWLALLRVFLLMSIPSAGLQIIFARQTAASVTETQQRQLARILRTAIQATFVVWLMMAGVALLGQRHWIGLLKISNPAALWFTVAIGLASLWGPIIKGVLQGRQNFLGLGWMLIPDGIGRFLVVLLVLGLGGQAAGGIAGALAGQTIAVALGAWWIRGLLRAPGEPTPWSPWLRRAVPLIVGFGSIQFMSNADVVFVQSVFAADKTPFYAPAAMIGLALATFTGPLTSVMFPKVVRSAALTQDTRAMRLALTATALLCGLAALACTLVPWLPVRIIFFHRPEYWIATPLVPWFAWCLLPLILANVLISNLLARERFAVVPWTVFIAVGYGAALGALRPRLLEMEVMAAFRTVIQTLGISNLLLLGVAALFTWRDKVRAFKPGNDAR